MLADVGTSATYERGGRVIRGIPVAMGDESTVDAGYSAVFAEAVSCTATVAAAVMPFRPKAGDALSVGGRRYTVTAVTSTDGDAAYTLTLVVEGAQ